MLIFTQLARIVAVLAFLFGIGNVIVGFSIATEQLAPREAALKRFAPWASSSGQVIDRGFYTILFAIGLGTLAEISLSLRKK
jgi:hypothetical protein